MIKFSQKFSQLLTLFIIPASVAIFGLSALLSPSVFAVDPICSNPNVSEEVKASSGCGGSLPDLSDVIFSIVNGVIAVTGVIALIFVVVGGIQYTTSAGDAAKTQKAKNTILYALIGLAIAALSFMIVNFVIINIIGGQINSAPTT